MYSTNLYLRRPSELVYGWGGISTVSSLHVSIRAPTFWSISLREGHEGRGRGGGLLIQIPKPKFD